MNAALGSVEEDGVGPLAAETEDAAGEWLRAIAREHNLWFPSTFGSIHQGASHTYVQKKSFRLIRPDFVLLPGTWNVGQVRSWTEPLVHAGHVVQDHIAAVADVLLLLSTGRTRLRERTPRIAVSDLLDPDNASKVRQILRSAPRVPFAASAHAHAALLTKHVQRGMAALRQGRPAAPKHPYLTQATFELQQAAAAVRRALHTRQHRLKMQCLAACFKVWCGQAGGFLEEFLDNTCVKQLRVLLTVNAAQLSAYGKAVRRACRADREAHLSALADAISSGPCDAVFAAYHRVLGHRRKKMYQPDPLPMVNRLDGTPCADAEEVQQRWRQHFGDLEGGRPTSMADLAQACLYPSSATTSADWPHPASVAQVPTFDMLQQTLATTKCAKAPGFDQIPPEMCKYFPHEVATVLFPLLLKQVWRGCEAIGWKGGQSVYFYKQKGSMQECGSYRAVLLLSAFAKACHKSLRPPLKCLYEQHAPSFQIGGRRGCSVTFGSHLVRGVQRWACARGLTAFTIFADIASAFYGAITQVVAASGGQPSPDALQRITAKLRGRH